MHLSAFGPFRSSIARHLLLSKVQGICEVSRTSPTNFCTFLNCHIIPKPKFKRWKLEDRSISAKTLQAGSGSRHMSTHGEKVDADLVDNLKQGPKVEEDVVQVHFIDKEGKDWTIQGKTGDNLLYLAKRFEIEMEGACEASLACTTCHVYVDHDYLSLLPEATETEEDLLDQAPFLKENSRLGCQIILNKQLDGIKLILPAATKNFYVDGHKPTPH